MRPYLITVYNYSVIGEKLPNLRVRLPFASVDHVQADNWAPDLDAVIHPKTLLRHGHTDRENIRVRFPFEEMRYECEES